VRIEAGWSAALAAFLGEREGLMASAREDLLRLAIEIARRATTRVLASDTAVTGELMAEAIASAARATKLVVCVHPDDELICRVSHVSPSALVDSCLCIPDGVDGCLRPLKGDGSC
jgi:flagellar biosynthesis/type III secretory pathway protein FliH